MEFNNIEEVEEYLINNKYAKDSLKGKLKFPFEEMIKSFEALDIEDKRGIAPVFEVKVDETSIEITPIMEENDEI